MGLYLLSPRRQSPCRLHRGKAVKATEVETARNAVKESRLPVPAPRGSSRRHPDAVSPACTRHGDPDAVSLQVLARGASSATVELRTGGFWVLQDAAGEVRVFVPGLEFPTDPKAPALPLRRALVDAVVGKQVQLVSAEALELQSLPGASSLCGGPGGDGRSGGTARCGRRGARCRLASSPVDWCRRRWLVSRGRCSKGRGRARSSRSRPCASTARVRSWSWLDGCE